MPSILQRLPAMSTITLLLLYYSCSIIATAAKINCCHPIKYTFSLNLSSDCSTNDIADNNGISESLCFIETNVDQSNGRRHQHDTSSSGSSSANNGEEPVRRTLQKSSSIIEVISIQFLEFDTSNQLNVIYTDESYVTAEMVDGDEFEFTSSSVGNTNNSNSNNGNSEEVGGASLILYGINERGDVVRNRFFWLFDTTENCNGEESVVDGDEIGWVIVEDVENNCQTNNNNTPSPTYSFFTDDNNGSITTTSTTVALTPSAADTPFPTPVVDIGDDTTAGETDDDTLGNDDTNGKPNDDVNGRNDDDDGILDDDTYNNSHSSSKSGKKGYNNNSNSKAGKTTTDAKTHKFFHDDSGKSGKTHDKSGKSSGKAFKGGDYDYDTTSAEEYPRGMKFFVKSTENVR